MRPPLSGYKKIREDVMASSNGSRASTPQLLAWLLKKVW